MWRCQTVTDEQEENADTCAAAKDALAKDANNTTETDPSTERPIRKKRINQLG